MSQHIVIHTPDPLGAPHGDLPALRRIDRTPERLIYAARAGLGAIPSGLGTMLVFISPQVFSLWFLFWAIWWPYPATAHNLVFAYVCTGALIGLVLLVGWLLVRRYRGFVTAVLRAPFTRISVTDRRVVWSVPWTRRPVMEIGRHRITGAILGQVDRRGRGNAAMMLVEGDPSADIDGNIHFDRLPHAARFVAAFS